MPSSITLTVSHLPTSTSFFLSALQPLNYGYRSSSEGTVGFGPKSPFNAPPDFWIAQEIPGVPAGAAHVAFPAPSRAAVEEFFIAALKAGGKIHGEPAVRDQSGYYSAAVIDFDGNSIEAVYRPGFGDENKENHDMRSVVSRKSMSTAPSVVPRSTVSRAAPSQIRSTTSAAVKGMAPSPAPSTVSQQPPPPPNGDTLATLLNEARNAANIARDLVSQVRPHLNAPSAPDSSPNGPNTDHTNTNNSSSGAGEAIVGTLLGVAAGAALHYAFTNRSKENQADASNDIDDDRSQVRPPSITGRSTTDGAPALFTSDYHHSSAAYDTGARYRAIEAARSSYDSHSHAPGGYITMHDLESPSEFASTVRAAPRRRNSIDGSTASSKASRRSGMRMLEAPPTSYRAPSVFTSTETNLVPAASTTSKSTGRSRASSMSRVMSIRSSSKTGSHVSSRHSRHSRWTRHNSDDEYDKKSSSTQTVLHVTEGLQHVEDHHPAAASSSSVSRSKSQARTSTSKAPSHVSHASKATKATKASERSHATTIRTNRDAHPSPESGRDSGREHHRDPQDYPLPPSRAATWAGSDSGRDSFVSARTSGPSVAARTIIGRLNLGGAGAGRDGGGKRRGSEAGSAMTRSVIGKTKEMEKLDVPIEELRPSDSVSQVSVNSGGSGKSRKSRW